MKVLVTGGAGFIGSHIVDALVKENEVVVVDNLSSGKKENINSEAKFYRADLNILDIVKDILKDEKPEVVFHLAAQVNLRKSLEDPILDAKENIIMSLNVLEACRKFKVRKIIYASTGGARVGEPEYLPVDEKHSLNPCSPYGISKHTVEHYVWMYNKLYNLDYLIFCFGNVYGPRDDAKFGRVISVFIEKMLKKEKVKIFGDGEQTRDFIYVLDLAEFIVENMEKKCKSKLFHLANGKQISVNEIFNFLKEEIGYGEVEYVDDVKGEVKDIVLDINLVEKELNWRPKHGIKEGLKETLEWFKGKDL